MFFKKTQPKPYIYLRKINIAEHKHWAFGKLKSKKTPESYAYDKVLEAFELPIFSSSTTTRDNDLGLDLHIPEFSFGEFPKLITMGNELEFYIFQRPFFTINVDLISLANNKCKAKYTEKYKMPLFKYLSRGLSINGMIFRYKPIISEGDMDYLIYNCVINIIKNIKKEIS